ncbi:MAG: Obg family GTPase CgtA, partial [Clostridia bacterium]|nr:Obg family GTPase CgtA [Clostridia bacterium]
FVVADIPGLIEGASEGQGLGHKFLRHVERVRLIVHVIDISASDGRDPLNDYDVIRKELKSYDERLYNLPEIIVANKMDAVMDEEALTALKEKVGAPVYPISAVTRKGVKELLDAVTLTLKDIPPLAPIEFTKYEYAPADKDSVVIERKNGTFYITGGYVEELARKAYLDDNDSFNWFQKKMREKGIIDMLREQGAKDGDTVHVLDLAFTFMD